LSFLREIQNAIAGIVVMPDNAYIRDEGKRSVRHKGREGCAMASVFDVAAYILEKCGTLTTWKLQKLVYYAQAWSLVWDEKPLFDQGIEAWANGPVVRELYNAHKGKFTVSSFSPGDSGRLSNDQKETIDAVIRDYGEFSSQQLSDLTHSEKPWKDARRGIPDGERGDTVIDLDALAEYYGGL